MLSDLQLRVEQDRIRLSGERRAQQPMVELGEHPADLGSRGQRPEMWTLRDRPDGRHPTPVVQLSERPDRHFLQAEHGGAIGTRKPDHLLEERLPPGRLRVPVEEVPGPDKQAFYCTADARRHLGPARLHAGLRPRARRRARPPRDRRRAGHVPVPLRRHAGSGRLPAQRALLSRLLEALQTLAVAHPAQGGGAPAGDGGVAASPARRPARAMAGGAPAGSGLAAPARADRVHGSRSAAAANGREAGSLERPARPFRPRRRSQRARTGEPRRARASTRPSFRIQSSPAIQRVRTTDIRSSASARSGRTRESEMRSRRRNRSPVRACSLRVIRWSR